MKKEISLVTTKTIQYIVFGTCWLLSAIFDIFNNLPCAVISSFFSLYALLACIICMYFSKNQIDDEMSREHLKAAKAKALDTVIFIILLFIIAKSFLSIIGNIFPTFTIDFAFDISIFISILLGLFNIFIGCFFIKFEKDGE